MKSTHWHVTFICLLVAASMVMAACGTALTGVPTVAPGAQPTAAPAGEVPGERVIRARFRDGWAEGFNYFTGAMGRAQGDALPYFYMPLAFQGSETTAKPWLAQSWEISEDCRSLTLHLYPDAVWSDGTPITTADVKYTLEMGAHPEVLKTDFGLVGTEAFWADPTQGISGIVITDDYTMHLDFSEGRGRCWPFEEFLDDVGIVPKRVFAKIPPADLVKGEYDEAQNPTVVSGPFQLGAWEKDVFFEMVARDHWWGAAYYGAPKVDKIVAVTTGDALPMLIAGDVDVVQDIAINELENLAQYDYLTVTPRETLMLTGIQYNMRPEKALPLTIRQAIDYATNRDEIVQAYTLGYGSKEYSFFTNEGPYVTPGVAWRNYDPEQTRRLVVETMVRGQWGVNRRLAVLLSHEQPHVTLWLEQLQAAGFKVEVQVVTDEVATERQRAGDYDITMFWSGPVRGHPERACSDWLEPRGDGYDRTGFYSEEFANYCKMAMSTTDEEVRRENFAAATRYYIDNGPWVAWTTAVTTWAVQKKVCGVVPSSGYPLIHRGGADYGLFDWYLCDQP